MRFGQDFACANIEQETGKEAQIKRQCTIRYVYQRTNNRTNDRRKSVHEQQRERSTPIITVYEHERYRIQPIRKIVRNNCDGDCDTDGITSLKAEPNAETIEETMPGEGQRTGNADLRMVVYLVFFFLTVVDKDGFFDDMEYQKAAYEGNHGSTSSNSMSE